MISKKERLKREEEVLKVLPNFLNQVLLLMDSGVSLVDSLKRVTESFKDEEDNSFKKDMYGLYERSVSSGENIINLIYVYSKTSGVRELTKLANMLVEAKNKGTEFNERLMYMSEELWTIRKQRGMEKIRIKESKMSFPLGIMLVSLLILTAAPAILQLY